MEPRNPTAIDDKIVDCALYEKGVRRPGRLPLDLAGNEARDADNEGFVWIGLHEPTDAEIAEVAEEFQLPPLAVEDAVKAHQRPKLEVYDDGLFVVLKPVRYIDHEEIVEVAELAIFLGPGFVVTVRHGTSGILKKVRREFDAGTDHAVHGTAGVLYRLFDLVVDGYEETIAFIDDDVDEIELQVFGNDGQEHAERIYKLKREIAEFRRALSPLLVPLQRLAEGAVTGVDKATATLFRDVYDHAQRSADLIDGHDRLLTDVLQADLARVGVRQSEIAVRQNEDMRKISAWAAIALLPTAVAGVYGMNFEHMPELGTRYGYFVVLALIAAACFALHRNFRRQGWL